MKRKFVHSFLATFALVALLLAGTSCSSNSNFDESDIQDMINQSLNGQWKIVNITVKKEHWEWNASNTFPEKGYYSCTVDLPELTQPIFDEGAVLAYYKYNKNSKTTLPYVQVYDFSYEDNNGVTHVGNYTENISCDFNLGSPSTATFIIEASDRERFDADLRNRDFQVVLIW